MLKLHNDGILTTDDVVNQLFNIFHTDGDISTLMSEIELGNIEIVDDMMADFVDNYFTGEDVTDEFMSEVLEKLIDLVHEHY